MSNFEKFAGLLKNDAGLQAQVKEAREEFASTLSRLSVAAGVPCAPEEFLKSGDELGLTDLDRAAGGWSMFPPVDYGPPV